MNIKASFTDEVTCPDNDELLVNTPDALVFSHFYNQSSVPFFQNLWFPPHAVSLDSDSKSFRNYSQSSTKYSIYRETNLETVDPTLVQNYYQILHSSLPDAIKLNNLPKKCIGLKQDITIGSVMRSKKIRIFPDADYIKHFNECFGASRYLYNKTIIEFKYMVEEIEYNYNQDAIKHGCIKTMVPINQGSKSVKKTPTRCGRKISDFYHCEKHSKCKIKYNIPLGFRHWRDLMIKTKKNIPDHEKWLLDIHFDTRQLVIKNAMGGIKSAFTNYKKGNIDEFEMEFQSKKDNHDRFYIDYRALQPNLVLFIKKFKKPLKISKRDVKWLSEHLQKKKRSDMTISREKPGIYFLQVPYEIEFVDNKLEDSAVAIDPGVITQGTFYDPSGICGKLGNGLGKKISTLFPKMDKLKSMIAKEVTNLNKIRESDDYVLSDRKLEKKIEYKRRRKKAREKKLEAQILEEQKEQIFLIEQNRSVKKLINRLVRLKDTLANVKAKEIKISKYYYDARESRKRIKRLKKRERLVLKHKQNVTKESHQKIISHYVSNYKYIIIPEFNSRGIAKKQKAQGMRKEARKTMAMCHGKFMMRLKTKVESIKDCHLIIVREDYTSQTCGRCGILHKVKRSRVFKCPNCKINQDRDTNAARNIFIRGLLLKK